MTFRNKYLSALGAVLIAVGLWTALVYAQAGPGLHRRGGMIGNAPGMMLLLRGANLTADQKAQVQQIMASHRSNFQELFGRLRTAQEEMTNRFFSAGALQASDLAPQVQQISLLRNQLAEERLNLMLEIRGVLTPEQLSKVGQLKQQMQALHDQMRNLLGPQQEVK